MTANNDFIEQRIIAAVRGLLVGRVNEILNEAQFIIPLIEFGDFVQGCSVAPVITLATCERTEKERIVRMDAYSLTIIFEIAETPESELLCYAYAGAVCRVVYDDPTFGGVVDRAVISGKKYVPPKKPHCGEGWAVVLTLRLTVEGIGE